MPAIHKAILPKNNIGTKVIPPSLKINMPTAISCKEVLNLPILLTGILTFIPARNSLRPDTAISLSRIINAGIVSQLLMIPLDVRINITAATKSLSAIGSKKVPRLETSFLSRAKYPSK